METFVKKDIVKESMKYNKGLTSKPEPFKCIEASTEVSLHEMTYAYSNFDPVWGEVLREPVEVGGGGLPGLLLRHPLSAAIGGATEPHYWTLGVQVRGEDSYMK